MTGRIWIYINTLFFLFSYVVIAAPYKQNSPDTTQKNSKTQFAPDEIIIKLKSEADKKISADRVIRNNTLGVTSAGKNVVTGLASLDVLHRKYGAKKMIGLVRKRVERALGAAGIQSTMRRKRRKKLSLKAKRKLETLNRIYKIKLKKGADVLQAVFDYENDPNVEYAEPNYIYHTSLTIPNDPSFSNLWGLQNTGQTDGTPDVDIDAPEAWDITTGSREIIVAVLDTGVDYNHEDLAANMWKNPGEIGEGKENDGIDNDGNGFVDDVYGIDARNSDSDPMDDHGHGTHCAGTIGGVGDNEKGVVGVNWKVSIMALKFLGSNGSGPVSDSISLINYAIYMGAHIMSNSWGGDGYSQALHDAIEAANSAGILFIAAAGNNGRNINLNPFYPASYDNDNIVTVAATDHDDNLAAFSNYDIASVDVAAPGVNVYSCLPDNLYGYKSGTSMATPHVAGLAALVWDHIGSTYSHMNVKSRILLSTDQIPAISAKVLSGGRINAYRALTDPINYGPWIFSLNPTHGPAGRSVVILGDNFGDTQGSGEVIFFDNVSAPVISWSNSQIECEVPDGSATGDIVVITDEGSSNGKSFTVCLSTVTFYRDADGDGYGDPDNTIEDCLAPEGYVSDNTDCDDNYSSIYPGAPEICNKMDNDCNDLADDNCTTTTIWVPDDYATIQSAINAASDWYEIIVKAGTYRETINFSGKVITLRSESGAATTIIDGSNKSQETITFSSGEDKFAVLDGFTITGGNSLGTGGGIYILNSSPTIKNCIIANNHAHRGGGVYCYNSQARFFDCIFTENSAGYYGGGISCMRSQITFNNCTIINNISDTDGGGIHIASSSTPIFTNCIISGNSSDQQGGGALIDTSSSTFINCIISGNLSSKGGGILNFGSTTTITNCTIAGNSANLFGGGIAGSNSSLVVVNSIIWSNSNSEGPYEISILGSSSVLDLSYSNTNPSYIFGDGSKILSNNINADPLFIDPRPASEAPTPDGYYHLKPGSLSIDSANSDSPAMDTDRSGFSRYDDPDTEPNTGTGANGDYYDMGAYEYQGPNTHPLVTVDSPNGSELWTGTQNILWTATDQEQTESDALLAALYYGTSATGPWTLIVQDISCSNDIQASYSWKTTLLPEGSYWIRITISDKLWGNSEDVSDNSFIIDHTPPGIPIISSSTHPEEGHWYTDNNPVFNWTEPIDTSGINGYSFFLDNLPASIPDTVIDSTDTNISYSDLADGIWYFHVRALDNMGNWGETAHYNINIRKTSPIIRHVPGEYDSIQAAIDASIDGDIILVADGTYYENINYLNKTITIRSEDGPTNTIIDGNNINRVVQIEHNLGRGAILDGFTITGGNSLDTGGGIYILNSSPTIKNCIIANNHALRGGGVYCYNSQARFFDCIFTENSAGYYGGGISCMNSPAVFTNCTISNNESDRHGGGIYLASSSAPIFTNCTISGNSSAEQGGGSWSDSSYPTFINCVFSGNSSPRGGGTGYFGSTTTLTNCTIAGNSATMFGGGIAGSNSSLVVVNSIIWNNSNSEGPYEISILGSSSVLDLSYSNINSTYISGDGSKILSNNINADPLFIDPRPASETPTSEGNYYLTSGSPCIDAGDPSSAPPGYPADDIEGDTRPQDGNSDGIARYDMGSDEYAGCADRDGDGFFAEEGCTTDVDCDDNEKDISPEKTEIPYNGKDDDCNTATKDDDLDSDGYVLSDDCDDNDGSVNPGAIEICDIKDNDCDGTINGITQPCYTGPDGTSGVGVCKDGLQTCDIQGDWGTCVGVIIPSPEVCDGEDNNCDGAPDEGCNDDHDDYCDANMTVIGEPSVCPHGGGDCDDENNQIYPGAVEVCDGIDNDCSGAPGADEVDGDSDGVMICEDDCNDGDPERFPGNPEICDGKDNDCNGSSDDSANCTISINLSEGWNLISLCLQPANTTIDEVLGTISNKCNSSWVFNNGWTAYYPAYQEYSDLEVMEAGWGYWLNMSASTILTFTGTTPLEPITLNKGWNLVGYNLPNPLPIADAIVPIRQNCESVWAYIGGRWKAYYPAYPEYSDLETMEPNYGYWIKTTQACSWSLP